MNATIQEIEGIDDYWGPAFRSVYEGEGHEAFVQQLNERIVQHDKEIEKLCNFHYQKKRKRSRRRPNKLSGVCEDQEETLQSSMSHYEDNNNHVPKRRRVDPKRLGGYINTFHGTQSEPSDSHNSNKVPDHNSSDEETSDMGISSDEYEKITEYHTLQQRKLENDQLISKEPESSTEDLRLYLRNRRLAASVHRQNLLISVEDVGNKSEEQSNNSGKDSGDHQRSMRDERPVDKGVDVNSGNDLRSYLRSKLSDEQLGQDKPPNAEHYWKQSQHEAIQYDERMKHQVDLVRERRRSLSSEYNKGPRQDNNIRYEKGQSQCASVEYNKNQIPSLSTEYFGQQNRNRGQGSLSSKRNRTLSRRDNFEYDKGQHRHVASEQDRNLNQPDRQRVKNRPMSADRGQNVYEYNECYVRPSPPSSSEHYTSRHRHESIGSCQSPREHDGSDSQRVFTHQLRGQSHHSAEYDSCDSYSRGESMDRPKIRSRRSLAEHNISQFRPSSASENYKNSSQQIKDQNQEQARGSLRNSIDYDRKSRSRHVSTVFDRGQGRQALTERRRNVKSRPLTSERYQSELQGVIMEYQKEKSHSQSDKKNQRRPSSAENYVQSGQSTEYIRGQNRSEFSEGHGSRNRPASADINIRQNQIPYPDLESEIPHKVSEAQKSRIGHSSLPDHFSDIQTDGPCAGINTSHNRSYVAANLQQEKGQGCPEGYQVDDQPMKSDVGRLVSSGTCIKHHLLLPETQRETYRKPPDCEDLNRPLSTQRQPTSFELCRNPVTGQHTSTPSQHTSTPGQHTSTPGQHTSTPGQHTSTPGKLAKPNNEENASTSSLVPRHSISNRVTSSQFFQNEILELELSHADRSDIESLSFDRQLKDKQATEVESSFDGVVKLPETVLISDTDISMDISRSRSSSPFISNNPKELNGIDDYTNIDLRSKLTNQLEASALLPNRGSSEPRDNNLEVFTEMSSTQDISGNLCDSVETVILDLDLKTEDAHQCITPEPNVKSDPNDTSTGATGFYASNESLKVIGSRLNQDEKASERLNQCYVKSEPIDHDTNKEISSPVDGNVAKTTIQQETPDYFHKFPSQSCDTVTLTGLIKSEIKQESDNETINTVESTLGTDLSVNILCDPNDEDKQGQATAKSGPASSNDVLFKVSVRDVNSINLLLSGAKIDPLNAVLDKTDESEDNLSKIDVDTVTTDSWYTPQKITLINYPDKQKNLNISALVNSADPRLRPRIKSTTIEIVNKQKTEVLGEKDVSISGINIEPDNIVATKSKILTYIDGQNEENKPNAPSLSGKCGKLVLDIRDSSKDTCCSSNKTQISPESPHIQDDHLFTSLKPIDNETQAANAIPGYDPSNKNHNINDWIDSVNKVAAFCHWTDQQVIGHAIPKIIGNSFESNISWVEWQEKLRTAFPPKINYGKMLLNMLNTKAKVGDSLVEYYYQKKNLLDKCNITGEKAIECIIFGIEDESVRTILESLDFDNQEQFLTFLSNFKNKP